MYNDTGIKPTQEDGKSILIDFGDLLEGDSSLYMEVDSNGTFIVELEFSTEQIDSLVSQYSECINTEFDYYVFEEWNSDLDAVSGDAACITATGGDTWDPTNQCLPLSASDYCT